MASNFTNAMLGIRVFFNDLIYLFLNEFFHASRVASSVLAFCGQLHIDPVQVLCRFYKLNHITSSVCHFITKSFNIASIVEED